MRDVKAWTRSLYNSHSGPPHRNSNRASPLTPLRLSYELTLTVTKVDD